jgi:hypothetical protein
MAIARWAATNTLAESSTWATRALGVERIKAVISRSSGAVSRQRSSAKSTPRAESPLERTSRSRARWPRSVEASASERADSNSGWRRALRVSKSKSFIVQL